MSFTTLPPHMNCGVCNLSVPQAPYQLAVWKASFFIINKESILVPPYLGWFHGKETPL
jgi:hypothetical protein